MNNEKTRLTVQDLVESLETNPAIIHDLAERLECPPSKVKSRVGCGVFYWNFGCVDSVEARSR
ncbi:MAG: hypothetical protein ACRCZS_02180 [Chroococcidiopsis sp.]